MIYILILTIFLKLTVSTNFNNAGQFRLQNTPFEENDISDLTYDEKDRPSMSSNIDIPSFVPTLLPPPPSMDIETEVPSHCKSQEFKVSSFQDLEKISNCEVLVGNLMISDFKYPIITLKTEKLLGNLTIEMSPELVRIEAPNLQLISSQFHLFELTSLSLISFPNLKWVNVLNWTILPILSTVNFNHEIEGIESITISDTSLTGFSGFLADSLKVLDINNNRFLDVIECNVEKIEYLRVSANSKDVKVIFPKLKTINRLNINNVESLNMDELELVEGSISLIDNYFQQVRFPKVSKIQGTLSLIKNNHLNHVEFPHLEETEGGLMIINNTMVEYVNFFPNLKIIGGGLELIGPIREISFKQLKLVKGSAIVKSSSSFFDCQKWLQSDITLIVRGGKLECVNYKNERTTSKTRGDHAPDVDKDSSNSKSASPSVLNENNRHTNHHHINDPTSTRTITESRSSNNGINWILLLLSNFLL